MTGIVFISGNHLLCGVSRLRRLFSACSVDGRRRIRFVAVRFRFDTLFRWSVKKVAARAATPPATSSETRTPRSSFLFRALILPRRAEPRASFPSLSRKAVNFTFAICRISLIEANIKQTKFDMGKYYLPRRARRNARRAAFALRVFRAPRERKNVCRGQ